MKLSVVIPVYNEVKTIKKILQKVMAVPLDKEIIIVDDGSTDGTREYLSVLSLRGAKRRSNLKNQIDEIATSRRSSGLAMTDRVKIYFHPRNLGKGAAIKTGLRYAIGNVLIIQDADLEYEPNDYLKLLKPINEKKTKVVYGSRLKTLKLALWGKNVTPLPLHYLANSALSLLTNIIYHTALTDMETGYKMFTRQVYKKLKITEYGFAVEPELTAKVSRLGYKIYEVPIKTKSRSYQEGKDYFLGCPWGGGSAC